MVIISAVSQDIRSKFPRVVYHFVGIWQLSTLMVMFQQKYGLRWIP